MRKFLAIAAALSLAGCSSTPSELEKSKDAVKTERSYSENYQEIYRRITTSARSCVSGHINAYASFQVDADLYSELGYGEITMSLLNLGSRNYYWKAKVEKAGGGSKLSVVAGNTLVKNSMLNDVTGWADGGTVCTNR